MADHINRILMETLMGCIRQLELGNLEWNMIDAIHFKLDWLHGILARYFYHNSLLVDLIGRARDTLTQYCKPLPEPERLFSGRQGRPKFIITKDHLEFFIERQFNTRDMAAMMNVSIRTIERRMAEFGLSIRSTYSDIQDDQLDHIILELMQEFPNTGYRRMSGMLTSRGIRIQQCRMREAMRRVNPVGVMLRALELRTIHRRRYWVPGPLALWHIDGNHKLIRWRFVIHGAIDGFSRMVLFLQCNTNNQASTVFELFQEDVRIYGLPSRVRTDKGGENADIAWFMLSHPLRGPNRGSHITGKSVHNQRIERLWRDVYTGCTYVFYNLFYDMEAQGLLDPSNEVHIFALHYIYLPRIRSCLSLFVHGHNNSAISTERNSTPIQLWVRGSIHSQATNYMDIPDLHEQEEMTEFGVDWEGPTPSSEWDGPIPNESAELVEVPETELPLLNDHYVELRSRINPLHESEYHGVDLYMQTLSFIAEKLGESCT